MLAETARKGKREMRDQGSSCREFTLIDRVVLRSVLETARQCCIYGHTQPEMMLDCIRRQPPFEPQRYAEYCAEFAQFHCRVVDWYVRVRVIATSSPSGQMRWEEGWVVAQEHYGSNQRCYAQLKVNWEDYYPSVTVRDFGLSPFPYRTRQGEGLDRGGLYTIDGSGLNEPFWMRDKDQAARVLDVVETTYLLGQTYGPAVQPFSANANGYGLNGDILYKREVFRAFMMLDEEKIASALNQVYAEGAKLCGILA